ncbi:MAG: DNA replication/repair protein RecF [Oscillospiraceae bacterium]|nr:DNA replication/repair protein RecF [Oscillospiraceae bacterium]
MKLTRIKIDGFKNLREIDFLPDEGYNIIAGENAQGKTNLLEALWLFTGCRSFRGTKEKDYLSFSGESLRIEADFCDGRRVQKLLCEMQTGSREKKLTLNGVAVRKTSRLFEIYHCVAFTPDDIELITGSPDVRRSFLDLCFSQLHRRGVSAVRRYQMILSQRNAVLKQRMPIAETDAVLDIWDRQLASVGTYIALRRQSYSARLEETVSELYGRISGGAEEISAAYKSQVFGRRPVFCEKNAADYEEIYYEKLKAARAQDSELGFTSCGVHRDDLELLINGVSAKEFGSQGQKKSLALALKLSQAQLYGSAKKESPVVLLDDVMGELDRSRQEVVYTIIKDMQVFITTCHDEVLIPELAGKRLVLKNGRSVNDI